MHGGQPGIVAAYAPGAFLALFGLACIARLIPLRYKIYTLASSLPLEEKNARIVQIKDSLKAMRVEQRAEGVSMRLPGEKVVSHGYNLHIKATAEAYYFALIPETGLYGGLIDFGETRKYREVITGLLGHE